MITKFSNFIYVQKIMALFCILCLITIPNSFSINETFDTFEHNTYLDLSFSYPSTWYVQKNDGFSNYVWLATFYDNQENWKIKTDLTIYSNSIIERISDNDIINNIFLSSFTNCNDSKFERVWFKDLPGNFQAIIFSEYIKLPESQKQGGLNSWWLNLPQSAVDSMFKDMVIFKDDFLTGYICSDFTPLDYKIFSIHGHPTFQIIYSWKQYLPNMEYYQNTSIDTYIWINDNQKYIININGEFAEANYDDYKIYYDDIIESIKISSVNQISSDLPFWIKVNFELWINEINTTEEFMDTLEFIIANKIIQNPTLWLEDAIKIEKIDPKFKDKVKLYVENQISDKELIKEINKNIIWKIYNVT